MLESVFALRITHTGLYADGRPNVDSVLISDLDAGGGEQRFQDHKVPVYVPVGGSITIPLTSRALFSFVQGAIAGLVAEGIVTAEAVPPAGALTSYPSSLAGTWADGTGVGNDVSVGTMEYVPPGGGDDGFLARELICGTNGNHILLVWQIANPSAHIDITSTDPFVTLQYKLDQAVAAPIAMTVRSGPGAAETEVSATPGGSTVGSHALLSIGWDELPDGLLTGLGQLLEVRVDVTLDTIADVAHLGALGFNWSP